MNIGKTVFSQVFAGAPWTEFRQCVARYDGDTRLRTLSCREQFLAMAFGQLTFRETLRELVTCLNSQPQALYHMGFRGNVRRSTLSDANRCRDWRIFADFAMKLIADAQQLYAGEQLFEDLGQAICALDSTVIELSLGLFPWAQFRRQTSAVKMHVCLDLATHIPAFIHVTKGLVSDLEFLDHLPVQPGTIYVMDRGFTDFRRLHRLSRQGAFFILRGKKRLAFRRRYSRRVDRTTGLLCDHLGVLINRDPRSKYPEQIRRIVSRDPETRTRLVLLTNHFELPAALVPQIYRHRWDIELFFRWIKQNLRIKGFYGTTHNAVRIQIWIAVAVYVMIAILKKLLHVEMELYRILQILSVNPFEKTPIRQLLTETSNTNTPTRSDNQLLLFEL
jgi:hypothetical protein